MNAPATPTIDDILKQLDAIIEECIQREDPLGYFAALYRRVTAEVKTGIANGAFEDGARMEQLDIVFAYRYLDAYNAYRAQQPHTQSWARAFELSHRYWPVTLQHLLIGINAHINLDLGISAAEVMRGKDIQALYGDFCKINEVLSSLVEETQEKLSGIWPFWKKILVKTGELDNTIVDFSMNLARDGAWKFAQTLAARPEAEWPALIAARDEKVARRAQKVSDPGWGFRIVLALMRLGELGSVSGKIRKLHGAE